MIASSYEDLEDLPVVPGEVVGWRAWRVIVRREPRLYSIFYDVEWPTDRWLVATDQGGSGDPHGICAARDRDHLLSMNQYAQPSYPRYVESGAIGEVALAGMIVPGERGWRAEKARVLSIEIPYGMWEFYEALRVAYKVPVTLSNVLTPRGEHHGHRP